MGCKWKERRMEAYRERGLQKREEVRMGCTYEIREGIGKQRGDGGRRSGQPGRSSFTKNILIAPPPHQLFSSEYDNRLILIKFPRKNEYTALDKHGEKRTVQSPFNSIKKYCLVIKTTYLHNLKL